MAVGAAEEAPESSDREDERVPCVLRADWEVEALKSAVPQEGYLEAAIACTSKRDAWP